MNPISKTGVAKIIIDVLVVMGGTAIMALGNMIFLNPYNIVPGGFTGFAIILNKTVLTKFPPGIMAIIFNIPLFLIALRMKGRDFGLLSVIGTISYSVFIDLIPLLGIKMQSITNDNALLATFYGGILLGVGYGIIVRWGGSTGGSDMLANLINTKKPALSYGTILLIIDGCVVILSGIAFSIAGGGIEHGIPPALYAFLVIFLSSRIADYILEGKTSTRAYFIICSDPKAMAQTILEKVKRGVTALRARGMYTSSEKEVLLCVVLRTQSAELKRVIFEADPKAFVFSENVAEAFGEGFVHPTKKP